MQRIQDQNTLYNLCLPIVTWMFRHTYRQIQYVGLDTLPHDGAIIFAPNHTNALQDALAILSIGKERKVFVARADIFKSPRTARLLNWFKIMPIRRMRDGIDEVRHNDATMDNAVETLQDGVPFCILPEGTHRPKHSLLPLGKGIFRIALRANEQFGDKKPVYIVPVGLEYGDYYHLWTSLTIKIGSAINVTEFVQQHAQLDTPQLMLALREELTLRMREQILWVPDDEHYEENLSRLTTNPPEPFRRFHDKPMPKWLTCILLLITAPIFLLSALLTCPLWIAWLLIRRKIKDPAFHNSVQFVWQLLIIPMTLFIIMPFWMVVQEYVYHLRQLKK